MKINPIECAEERALLQQLDNLLSREKARQTIEMAIATTSSKLHADASATLAWEPIPLDTYQVKLGICPESTDGHRSRTPSQ